MKKKYNVLLIFYLLFSCNQKNEKIENIPNFNLEYNRIVDIKISNEVRSALNVLANSNVTTIFNCTMYCNGEEDKSNDKITKKVSFYFEINELNKNIIIVQENYYDCCLLDSYSVIRSIIPIEKIAHVNIKEESEWKDNNGNYVDHLFIAAEFDGKLFQQKNVNRHRDLKSNEISYSDIESNCELVMIDQIIIQNGIEIKEAIERLMLEYKK